MRKGICPACKQSRSVKKDGTMGDHVGDGKVKKGTQDNPGRSCSGTDSKPERDL